MTDAFHVPVLLDETLGYLRVTAGGLYVDCTLGGGGHSRAILERGGKVIGIDRDPDAIAAAAEKLSEYQGRFELHSGPFSRLETYAGDRAGGVDGVLMDLGVSSHMLDTAARGFSFQADGPLLMTMGGGGVTAREVINTMPVRELAEIFRRYGEERNSRIIAEAIGKFRALGEITTTGELSAIIERTVRGPHPQKAKARIFQALRIHVNDELGELQSGLAAALRILRVGGRLCVIAYHSLEDRIVKLFMREKVDPCVCPKDIPECRCGRVPELKLITRRAVTASGREIADNPRARSAKLRAAEKIAGGG